jgi:hypothetical protein
MSISPQRGQQVVLQSALSSRKACQMHRNVAAAAQSVFGRRTHIMLTGGMKNSKKMNNNKVTQK